MEDVRRICKLIWEILQFGCTETLEEAQRQPLFYVFRNDGIAR